MEISFFFYVRAIFRKYFGTICTIKKRENYSTIDFNDTTSLSATSLFLTFLLNSFFSITVQYDMPRIYFLAFLLNSFYAITVQTAAHQIPHY